MLSLFEQNEDLFASWFVLRYEREGDSYMLQLGAVLHDGSRLELRDYLFVDGSRKYAYQWMEPDGSLRQRWDNAPHWPENSNQTASHTSTKSGNPGSVYSYQLGRLVDIRPCLE